MLMREFIEPCSRGGVTEIFRMKRKTYLLALLNDTIPEILPARIEVFYSIADSFLDRLLGPGLDLILERELNNKNTGNLRVQSSQIAQKR